MIIEESTVKTQAVFSDDKAHRYLLSKEWDASKPRATVIMTNPSKADVVSLDFTTLYMLNNLKKLDFGEVDVVNISSKITTKLNAKEGITDGLENKANLEQILEAASRADKIIIAWGKIGDTNKTVKVAQTKILEELRRFEDKLYIIKSANGRSGFHPLSAEIRFNWILGKFPLPEHLKENPLAPPVVAKSGRKSRPLTEPTAVEN